MRMILPKGVYLTSSGRPFQARKLITLGRSFALVLPKQWVKLYCKNHLVELLYDKTLGEFRIRPLSTDKKEAFKCQT